MKPAPEFKKRKVDAAASGEPSHRNSSCAAQDEAKAIRDETGSVSVRILQQAKNFAVTQAQQECSAGNFRIFDSPFGNFLVPVIPTHEELSRQA